MTINAGCRYYTTLKMSVVGISGVNVNLLESPHSTKGHCIAARECQFDATERLINATVQGFFRVRGL